LQTLQWIAKFPSYAPVSFVEVVLNFTCAGL
jgi:hypothetical protein